MSMTNHQEQQEKDHPQEVLFSIEKSHKNPNILLFSSQDFETSHHQHNIIHGANETYEEEERMVRITKDENYEEIIKKLGNHPKQLNTYQTFKDGPADGSFFCSPQVSHPLKDGPANNPSSFSPIVVGEEDKTTPLLPLPPHSPPQEVAMVGESGRDRLKRHRENMVGQDKTIPPLLPPPPPSPPQEVAMVGESGRDRLKRHRENMAGQVWIPDIWGHEDLLQDWIDCTVFDSSLGNKTIMSARAALVQEERSTLRIHI